MSLVQAIAQTPVMTQRVYFCSCLLAQCPPHSIPRLLFSETPTEHLSLASCGTWNKIQSPYNPCPVNLLTSSWSPRLMLLLTLLYFLDAPQSLSSGPGTLVSFSSGKLYVFSLHSYDLTLTLNTSSLLSLHVTS